MENIGDRQVPQSRQVRDKQRCRTSTSYEKNMNKFLTIIYHNINRLQEDKAAIKRSDSGPYQLKDKMSVSTVYQLARSHSSLSLHSAQVEYARSPTSFKRKVTFSNLQTKQTNFPG